jgi:hypothetical protein
MWQVPTDEQQAKAQGSDLAVTEWNQEARASPWTVNELVQSRKTLPTKEDLETTSRAVRWTGFPDQAMFLPRESYN